MMLELVTFNYEFPAKSAPTWADKVDRWYQLDAPAFGLVNAAQQNFWSYQDLPQLLILASPGASNETDFQFAKALAPSPAKFVHTLPSIRVVPLMQVLGWTGPVLCFQKDPETFLSGLVHAFETMSYEQKQSWVLSTMDLQADLKQTVFARVSERTKDYAARDNSCRFLIEVHKREKNNSFEENDSKFWNWLFDKNHSEEFLVGQIWSLRKV